MFIHNYLRLKMKYFSLPHTDGWQSWEEKQQMQILPYRKQWIVWCVLKRWQSCADPPDLNPNEHLWEFWTDSGSVLLHSFGDFKPRHIITYASPLPYWGTFSCFSSLMCHPAVCRPVSASAKHFRYKHIHSTKKFDSFFKLKYVLVYHKRLSQYILKLFIITMKFNHDENENTTINL